MSEHINKARREFTQVAENSKSSESDFKCLILPRSCGNGTLKSWVPLIWDPPLNVCFCTLCIFCGGSPEIKWKAYLFISEICLYLRALSYTTNNHPVIIKFMILKIGVVCIVLSSDCAKYLNNFTYLPAPNSLLYLVVTYLLVWNNSLAFVLHNMKNLKLFKECFLI